MKLKGWKEVTPGAVILDAGNAVARYRRPDGHQFFFSFRKRFYFHSRPRYICPVKLKTTIPSKRLQISF